MAENEKPQQPKKPAPPVILNPAMDILSGGNPRGEVMGCPTGLSGGLELPRREGDAVPGTSGGE